MANLFPQFAFWTAAALIAYTYAGYPLWMYLRSRIRPRPWKQAPIEPSVSIILAVHNGASLLREKIEHLLSLDYPPELIEVIVVSDGSTDGTNEILRAQQRPRVRPIICQEHRGKAAALNAGMARATGELLLFVDIRPRLELKALRFLVSNFADPEVGCAAGQLVLNNEGHDPGTGAVGGLYWRYEQWIRDCEAKVDSPLGVYGGFYAVRRTLARPLPDGAILDDMLQPLSTVRQGYRSVLDKRAIVFDSWPKTAAGEFNRKVRTLAGNFQMLQLAPWLLRNENRLRFSLASHKLLRLLVPVLLVVVLWAAWALRSASPLYAIVLLGQLAFYLLGALGFAWGTLLGLNRVTGPANAFCLLNAAVLVGFYKFLFTRGPLWRIWVTAAPTALAPDRHNTRPALLQEDTLLPPENVADDVSRKAYSRS